MNFYVMALVIFLTSLLTFAVSHHLNRGHAELDRLRQLADRDQAAEVVSLPRAGYLPAPGWSTYAHQAFAGAADPAQMAPVPWDLAGAAYALGQQRATQNAVELEVAAIIAEVESNPERWQT